MTITDAPRSNPTVATDALAFWRLWAVAAFAHVVSNGLGLDFGFRSVANLIVGLAAIAVVVDPRHRIARTVLVASVPLSAFAEAPFLGNHWFVAAVASAAALIARPWADDEEWWHRFAPTGRVVLLVFYGFAAFAKLNAGFFDSVESCSRFFANQALGFWQLPEVGGDSLVAQILPWVTIAIELSVPVLLLIRRTRPYGVWLAIAFHLILTLDLQQHFFDFTMMLIPLFLLFAGPGVLSDLDARLPRSRIAGGRVWILVAAAMVVAATMPAPDTAKGLTVLTSWALWIGLAVVFVRALRLYDPRALAPAAAEPMPLRPASWGAAVIVAVIVLNGLSPYLELKTAAGFNMYANLVTAGGETNHYIVPGTAELRSEQTETAEILSTTDEDLAEYIDSGFAIPLANLRDYLIDNQDIAVSFLVDRGSGDPALVELERAGDHPEWLEAQPWYEEKLLLFRAVPIGDAPACQNSFLPAR